MRLDLQRIVESELSLVSVSLGCRSLYRSRLMCNVAHAALEPTEPPSPTRPSNDSTLVNSVAAPEPGTAERRSRPRPKLRYSTSESSWDDTDDEGSDEDPPWWTFTQRGMHKLKMRNQRLQEAGQRAGTDDSGKEEGGHSSSHTKTPKRRSNKRGSEGPWDKPPVKKGSSGHESMKRWSGSREYTPKSSSRNLQNLQTHESPKPPQRPPVLPANMRMSTPAFLKSRRGTETPPIRIKMKRRYSAPSSPVPAIEPMPPIAMITSPVEVESPDAVGGLHSSLPIGPIQSIRSLSIPRPPFLKRHSESLTDTEAVASSSIRLKAKRAQTAVKEQAREDSQQSGTSTPMRRGKERKQTMSKLKLNLPDQVTQHFAHGWPHAGSWQDALYGYYDEAPKEKEGVDDSGKSSKEVNKRRGSTPHANAQNDVPIDTGVTVQSPGRDGGSDTPGSPAPRAPPKARGKSRRRKYRQALAPPTPSGLGFTDAEKGHGPGYEAWKHGQVGDDEFDWGNRWNGNGYVNGDGHGNRHDPNRITEESMDLSRSETRQTATEKVGTATRKAGAKIKGKVVPNDGMDWKQRLRRVMFLDARVTIWIRFANLAVVVCSLGMFTPRL